MVFAMFGFAIEDLIVKYASATLPQGQIVIGIGLCGALASGLLAVSRGHDPFSLSSLNRAALARVIGEIVGSIGFITAIVIGSLSSASAILQATPLLVTLGGAVVLGEQVGWRRWSAILTGLFGVLLIVRPGLEVFEAGSVFAVMGAVGLALRDLAIRAAPPAIPSVVMTFQGMVVFAFTGGLMMLYSEGFQAFDMFEAGMVLGAAFLAFISYLSIVSAVRLGEVAIVTPFRYSRLVFAMIFGVVLLGERPDAMTLAGALLVVASGIYTLYRESRLSRV